MSHWHKLDPSGNDFVKGGRAEAQFKQMVVDRWGQRVISDTTKEQDFCHTDFILHGKHGNKTVDVKMAKELNGVPVFVVEIMCNGGPGWLYGEQDYVALQKPSKNGFVVIGVGNLRAWVAEHAKIDIVRFKEHSLNRVYARSKPDRRWDLMIMLPWKVAEELKEWEL